MKGISEHQTHPTRPLRERATALFVALPLALSLTAFSPAKAAIDAWQTFYDSGVASLDAGDLPAARIKLNLATSMTGASSERKLTTLRALENLYEQTGETVLQERALLDQLDIYKHLHEVSSVRLANVFSKLAAVKGYNKEFGTAVKYGSAAVAMLEKYKNSSKTELGVSLNNLAWAEEHSGKPDMAELHYRRAMQVLAGSDPLTIMYGMTALNLAEHYRSHNQPQMALKLYRRSLRTFQQILDYDDDLLDEVERRIDSLERETNYNKHTPQKDAPDKDFGGIC